MRLKIFQHFGWIIAHFCLIFYSFFVTKNCNFFFCAIFLLVFAKIQFISCFTLECYHKNYHFHPTKLEPLQGDPNQNCPFLKAITLKLSTSEPMLVKPKCVWEAVVVLKNCKQTAENVNKFLKIQKIYRLSNTFWLYQHRVKYAPFLSYIHSFQVNWLKMCIIQNIPKISKNCFQAIELRILL